MQNLLMDNKFADAEGQRRISLSRNVEEDFGVALKLPLY